MEISKKKFVWALFLCGVIGGAWGMVGSYVIQNNFSSRHQPMIPSANVFLTIQTEMGTYDLMTGNIITDIGENATRYGLENVARDVKYIALGNSTIDQTKTKLDTEASTLGADRIEGTRTDWTSSGDYAFNVTKKFTFGGDITLNATALHWSDVTDTEDAYALASFTKTAFANNWNLTITWSVIFNGN